jgi:D-lactate dehydrogenase
MNFEISCVGEVKKMHSHLDSTYRQFHEEVAAFIPRSRLFTDPLRTLAYGTNASFYRLIPKIVIKVQTSDEVSQILRITNRLKVPVTFRSAGTSLSGQAVSDSVLLVQAGAWRNYRILDNGEKIELEPGIIGGEANALLLSFGRKIGPDPASINACMIGGIAANNSSGMCCGTAQNSYKTVESMKIIFYDGTRLDTADPSSRAAFLETHKSLVQEIERIRDEIQADPALSRRISDKFKIKNTTGYSINAFVDFFDPVDIVLHLMIGSEGTLAFNAGLILNTVIEHPFKASSLIIFPDVEHACTASIILRKGGLAYAVELMDYASLKSVADKEGMPQYLKTLAPGTAALLVETRSGDKNALARQMDGIINALLPVETVFPIVFTDIPRENEKLWNIRKGLIPAVGGVHRVGTAFIIEDITFPIDSLAKGTLELQELMQKYRYEEGIIFGHALEGNLHFVLTPDFSIPEEVQRYEKFMEDVCTMVIRKYDGSLKAEHGTGRNMAPFVEFEWGAKAYEMMKRIKKAFDPYNLLNPGAVINDNPRAHLENLKPLYATHELVDKCIECGFCEPKCPSRNLSTTPRHRITVRREISRLSISHEDPERLAELERQYVYLGEQTCAADGMCATACPVTINTGDYTEFLRSEQHSGLSRNISRWAADHFATVISMLRIGLKASNAAHAVLGSTLMGGIAKTMRLLSGNRTPLWTKWMPTGVSRKSFTAVTKGSPDKVVYFPSCISRTMGPAKGDNDQRAIYDAMLSILGKAGYDVLYPAGMENFCCGTPLESKGFFEQANQKSAELEKALYEASEGRRYPILCDLSTCLYRMRRTFDPTTKLFEPVEFITTFLMDRLTFTKQPETISLHVTCSSLKMGHSEKFRVLGQACAETVVIPPWVGCCGFAGDRGFNYPELNASALADLKSSLPLATQGGYSNNRTCEIGLSHHSGVSYQSIVYLVDRCTSRKA